MHFINGLAEWRSCMRRALAKRLIPLLMVLVLVIPYFAVSYYDVYGMISRISMMLTARKKICRASMNRQRK